MGRIKVELRPLDWLEQKKLVCKGEKENIKGRSGNKKGVDAVSGLSPILVIFPPSSVPVFPISFLLSISLSPARCILEGAVKPAIYIAAARYVSHYFRRGRSRAREGRLFPNRNNFASFGGTTTHISRSFFPLVL